MFTHQPMKNFAQESNLQCWPMVNRQLFCHSNIVFLLFCVCESKNGQLDVSQEAASHYKQIQRHLINQTNNLINHAKLFSAPKLHNLTSTTPKIKHAAKAAIYRFLSRYTIVLSKTSLSSHILQVKKVIKLQFQDIHEKNEDFVKNTPSFCERMFTLCY